MNNSKFLCIPGPLMCFLVNCCHLKDVQCRVLHGLVFKYCLRCFLGLIVIRSSLSVRACQNQEGWPAKWLDSGEPTAREGFVLQAHFDAGTRLRLHKETHAPSTLRPAGTERKENKQASNFYTTYSTHRSNVALRVISQFCFF